jgi:transcriptional regulator with XRE-family HTH domain
MSWLLSDTKGRYAKLPASRGFGEMLRQFRDAQGMSQEVLADSIAVDRSYISRIEGGRRNPSAFVVNNIAMALLLTPGERAALLAASVGLSREDVAEAYNAWPDGA